MPDSSQVISYSSNKVSLFIPENGNQRDIAYVRPGDQIELNFDIKDQSILKVEVVKGDLHLVFNNGSTITIASLVAIGFYENAPKIKTLDGKTLSLEDLLNTTEVLNYNEAILILANRKQASYSSEEPKIVQVSSDQEDDSEAGIPISGQGEVDIQSSGIPVSVLEPIGVVPQINQSVSQGPFVVTIWTTNSPYTLDKSNYLPGETEVKSLPQLKSTVYYGSQLAPAGIESINGVEYDVYRFSNGNKDQDDPFLQIFQQSVSVPNATNNIFINNNTDNMKYVFELDYSKGGVFPLIIDIIVPFSVSDFVTLEAIDGGLLSFESVFQDEEQGGWVYRVSNISPQGKMDFFLLFPEGTPLTSFDLNYSVSYIDESTGKIDSIFTTDYITLYPVAGEQDLNTNNGYILSSMANPVNVTTGSGDDIILGGGAGNKISSGAGNDKVFSYSGSDQITLGDGDDQLWGSLGDDVIEAGEGEDSIYYDNRNINIGGSFNDSYYRTNLASSGVIAHVGFSSADLEEVEGEGYVNAASLSDGDVLVKKNKGYDIVINGMENFHLTSYNDNVIVNNSYWSGPVIVFGGQSDSGKADTDTITIDDKFEGAIVDIAIDVGRVLFGAASAIMVSFSEFEIVKGSKNDDIFKGNFVTNFTDKQVAYTFDGAGGYDILSYDNISGSGTIEFDANAGSVQKKDSSDVYSGIDRVRNMEEVIGTTGADIYYGSFSNSYFYSGLQTHDLISYEKASSGMTLILDVFGTDIFVYKTTFYDSVADIDLTTYHDTIASSLISETYGENLILSNRADKVIVSDQDTSYRIHAGGGRDVLSYVDLSQSIVVTFSGEQASVQKGSNVDENGNVVSVATGGIDVFDIMFSEDNVNIYKVVGSVVNDLFLMDDGMGSHSNHYIDGDQGTDTISYEGIANDGEKGVSFTMASDGNSYVRRNVSGGAIDYFINIERFVGSNFDDIVIFTSAITADSLLGLYFDLGDGEDIVNYYQISRDITDFISVSFQSGVMNVEYTTGSSSSFLNSEGIVGTTGNDIFQAVGGLKLSFDASLGDTDEADYSLVNEDLVFNMSKFVDNVEKQSATSADPERDGYDTVLNVEIIKGGMQNNVYYLTYMSSYTIDGTASNSNYVSYFYSSGGISYNVLNSEVNKGTFTDTLINVNTVKGSKHNDSFVVESGITDESVFHFYGNDALIELPSFDTDVVDFSAFTTGEIFMLDTSEAGSYNEIVDEEITVEGDLQLNVFGSTFHLYHIEGVKGSKEADTFTIISTFAAPNYWSIDGHEGVDTVDYSQDDNLRRVDILGNVLEVLEVILGKEAYITRFYQDDTLGSVAYLDTLINVEELLLSKFDDYLGVSETWADSSLSSIEAGTNTARGDTLSFSSLDSDLIVNVSATGVFSVTISDGTLPSFSGFENIRLSRGNSVVIFEDGADLDIPMVIQGIISPDSSSTIDFSQASSAITIILAQLDSEFDTISGGVNATSLRLLNITDIVLTAYDDTVYGSAIKNISFHGNGGNDTLSYSNILYSGISLYWVESQVFKQGTSTIFDSFDDSFKTFEGTVSEDSFYLTDLSVSLDDISINLLDGAIGVDDFVKFSTSVAIVYDVYSYVASDGTNNVDLSHFIGLEKLIFSDHDDTITFGGGNDSEILNYVIFDGGVSEGSAQKNTLDFSEVDYLIFDSLQGRVSFTSNSVTDFNLIQWQQSNYTYLENGSSTTTQIDTKYENFFEIKAGSNGALFYGDLYNNFNFYGGESSEDILSYKHARTQVYIYLLENNVQKGAERIQDTFDSKIDTIVGSAYQDVVVIDSIPTNPISIEVDGGDGGELNTVEFQFDNDVYVEISFDSSGTSSFVLHQGSNANVVDAVLINFSSYKLTENDDLLSVDTTASISLNVLGGGGEDKAAYTGTADIVFDSQSYTVYKTLASNILEDRIVGFEMIYYGGTGFSLYQASNATSMTYLGNDQKAFDINNSVLSYANGTAIKVDFSLNNGLFSVEKNYISTPGRLFDYFDRYITTIEGSSESDIFIMDVRDQTFGEIRILGGEGQDSVSYERFATAGGGATEFFIDDDGVFQVEGTANLAGYSIDSASVESYTLTKGDDIYRGILSSSLTFNGDEGNDLLDYSSANYNITANFYYSFLMKEDGVNGTSYSDTVMGFESLNTGSGDDTIVITNEQITGLFDSGSGTNVLDASMVTFSMDIIFLEGFNASITYGTAKEVSNDYLGFSQISLGSGSKNSVTYTHDPVYESEHIRFEGQASTSNSFIFSGEAGFFTIYNSGQGGYLMQSGDVNFDTIIDNNNYFLEIITFSSISAFGTSNVLKVSSQSIGDKSVYIGGNTGGDILDYSSSMSGLTVTMDNINSQDTFVITNNFNPSGDELVDIETIILSSLDDILSVANVTNYSNYDITVIGGEGKDTLSFEQMESTGDFIAGEDLSVNGWSVQEFEVYSLTANDDTLVIDDSGSYEFDGGDGKDTANYSSSSLAISISKEENDASFIILKGNGGALSDKLSNFENFILTEYDDSFVYKTSGDSFTDQVSINMGEGTDSINFSGYTGSAILTFILSDSLLVQAQDGIDYLFQNMELITGTDMDEVFVIEEIPTSSNVEIDGGSGNNVLDLSALNVGEDLQVDLYNDILLDSSGNDSGLNFSNLNSVIGSGKIKDYILAAYNVDNQLGIYDIVTNNAQASISYNHVSMIEGIEVVFSVSSGSNSASVDKGVSSIFDSIAGGFSHFEGTSNDDTFIFEDGFIWGGFVLDGFEEFGYDLVDMSAILSSVSISLNVAALSSVVNVNSSSGLLNSIENIILSQVNDTTSVNFEGISSSMQAYFDASSGEDTLQMTGITGNDDIVSFTLSTDSIINISTVVSGISSILSVSSFEIIEITDSVYVDLVISSTNINSIKEVTVQDSSDSSVDLSSVSTKIRFDNGELSLMDTDLKLTGFSHVVLGAFSDELYVASSLGNINISSGGSAVATPDKLVIEGAGNLTLTGSQVSFGNNNFYSFPDISFNSSSGNTVNILNNFIINSINSITGGGSSVLSFLGNTETDIGSFNKNIVLDLVNKFFLIGSDRVNIDGFSQYNMGLGNDKVTTSVSVSNIKIDAGEGNNYLVVQGPTGTFKVTSVDEHSFISLGANAEYKDFYNVSFATASAVVLEGAVSGKRYEFDNLTSFKLTQQLALATIIMDGSSVVMDCDGINIRISNYQEFDLSSITIANDVVFSVAGLLDGGIIKGGSSNTDSIDFSSIISDMTVDGTSFMFTSDSKATSFLGFESFQLANGKNTVSYSHVLNASVHFKAGGSDQDTVIFGGTGGGIMNGNILTQGTFTHTFDGFEVISSSFAMTMYVNLTKDQFSNNFREVSLSSYKDTVIITGVENNQVINTGYGSDIIMFLGGALLSYVQEFDQTSIFIDGKWYQTGGSYLVVTSESGNMMYILDATLDDILSGGVFDQNSPQDPQQNDSQSAVIDNSSIDANVSNEITSVSEFRSFSVEENLFEGVEGGNLDLSYQNLGNLDLPIEEEIDFAFTGDIEQVSNEYFVDENILEVLEQTLTNEEDQIDDFIENLDIDVLLEDVDSSMLIEEMVEETIIEESDITNTYKLDSERNEDGALKINNNNGSNNGGLGSA